MEYNNITQSNTTTDDVFLNVALFVGFIPRYSKGTGLLSSLSGVRTWIYDMTIAPLMATLYNGMISTKRVSSVTKLSVTERSFRCEKCLSSSGFWPLTWLRLLTSFPWYHLRDIATPTRSGAPSLNRPRDVQRGVLLPRPLSGWRANQGGSRRIHYPLGGPIKKDPLSSLLFNLVLDLLLSPLQQPPDGYALGGEYGWLLWPKLMTWRCSHSRWVGC